MVRDVVILGRWAPRSRASKSYGIQVARLAGMPTQVLNHARHALSALEAHAESSQAQVDLFAAPPAVAIAAISALESALDAINPDDLSPKEALEALYRLKKLGAANV